MAAHSSVLAWRISGTGEPGGLPSMGSHRVGQDQSYPARINYMFLFFIFFACGSSVPVRVDREGGAAAWLVGTLAAPSVQGHGLPLLQEYGPIRDFF